MAKKQFEIAKAAQTTIRREIDRDKASRYDHRLHALLLVAGGRSCAELAQWFGENASTARRCVRRCYGVDPGLRRCQRLFRQMETRPRRMRANAAADGA